MVSAGDNKLIKVDITQENILKYNFDTISISPSDYKEFIIDNPWYLDTSQAPDFQSIIDVEKNTIKEFTVPEDTYSVNNYNLQVRLGGTSTITTKTINISNKSHLNLLKDYYNSIKSSAGNYIWTSSQLYSLKYYYLFHGYSVSNDSFASRWNGTPTRNNSILIPIMYNDNTALRQGTFQEIPIVTNISITFDENNFSYNLPEHKIYGGNDSGLTGEFTVPAGTYTPLQYHECIRQVLPSDNTWIYKFTIDTMYQYPFAKISMKSVPHAYYNGGGNTHEHNTFNDLYGKLHLVYPCDSNYKIGHPCNSPATNRCLSCTSGIWNIDDFVNYVNTTDEEKLFGCKSTTHEIFVTADIPFIINPVCSITKLGEADITPEGSTDYTFGTQKRIFYHPMYKQIDCTVTYNGTNHTISGRYTPAELLREIKTLTNADIKVYNNNDEYNINFPEGLTISDNPFFTSTKNLSGLSRMDFTISILQIGYSQSEYTFNINDSVSIIPYSGDYTYSLTGNLPCGLTFGSDGSITGVCDHPVITVLSITISTSDITKTVELTLNILPGYKCKENDYCKYYVDNELSKCEAIIDKGLCNEYEFTLEDNEHFGLVGPYLYILPANHAIDLNIQTITDDNYETNNNNVNCYIKGFTTSDPYNYYIPWLSHVFEADYDCYIEVRDSNTDEIIERSDLFNLSNLDFTGIINYFNEKSTEQLSITYDECCIYLHGVNFKIPNDGTYSRQYFYNVELCLESNSTTNNKISLIFKNYSYFIMYYNNTIFFIQIPSLNDYDSSFWFDIPSTPINNSHILCSYTNYGSDPIALYMDVVSPLAEQNSANLKTMYQVSKFVYEFGKLYDLLEFTIPIGCYFTTTPVTEIAGPYVLEGVLPDGLIFDSATGNISGTCNEIINSSVNVIASDNTSEYLTFNTVDIQNYNNVYRVLNNKTTTINPITPINNYLDGIVTYENVLPNGCTFDKSTGTLTINTSNKYEYISVNCIQTRGNTELKINNNILIKVLHYVQIQNNIVDYS